MKLLYKSLYMYIKEYEYDMKIMIFPLTAASQAAYDLLYQIHRNVSLVCIRIVSYSDGTPSLFLKILMKRNQKKHANYLELQTFI